MNHSISRFALAAPLALVLVACDSQDVENTPVDDVDEIVAEVEEYDPMARDYELSEEAQARRDEFDEAAFQQEYAGYRDEIRAEEPGSETADEATAGSAAGNATGDATSSSGSGAAGDAPAATPTRANGTNMPDRSNMTWSYLDRNDDGQLSVAEYAIWAIPLDPTEPEANDARPPYVIAEEANKAADSFFYYDQDGDTYLSQREFTSARRGDDLG